MLTHDIFGDNRFDFTTEERHACRGIVVRDGMILLSYETATDQYFIPGGGLEENETLKECCMRELSEETGLSVNPTEHFLTVNEYYEEWHFVSHYFRCEITGETDIPEETDLTESGLLDSLARIEFLSRLELEGIEIPITRIDRSRLATLEGLRERTREYGGEAP